MNFDSNSGLSFISEYYPLGISFYCFQAIGYQIDLYKGLTRGAKNLQEFCCLNLFSLSLLQDQ